MPITLSDSVVFVGKIRVERVFYKGQFNLVMYSAYEPCDVSTHDTLMQIKGKWYGKMSTKIPRKKSNEEREYAAILEAFPESRYGTKAGGSIHGMPK